MLVPWRVEPFSPKHPSLFHHTSAVLLRGIRCAGNHLRCCGAIHVVRSAVFGGKTMNVFGACGEVIRQVCVCVCVCPQTQDASHHQDFYLYYIFIILLQYVFSMGSRDNPNHTHSGLKSWWNCDEMSHKMWELWDLFFAPCRRVMPHKAFEWLAQSLCWKFIWPLFLQQVRGGLPEWLWIADKEEHTVDGRNLAPVDMVNIPLTAFQVVRDLFHQQYISYTILSCYMAYDVLSWFHRFQPPPSNPPEKWPWNKVQK